MRTVRDVIADSFESDPPKFLDIPFGYNDIDEITKLMSEAGIENIESNVVSKEHTEISAESIAKGVVEGNPGVLEINQRGTVSSDEVVKKATEKLKEKFGGDKPKVSIQEIVFSGVKK